MNVKTHWDKIYSKHSFDQLAWFQPSHKLSLELIETSGFNKNIKIIDIGGGDAGFAELLLDRGYTDITILELSDEAIKKAKARLGDRANSIKWIQGNVLDFSTFEEYDFWHDRAVFHFLTKFEDIQKYKKVVQHSLKQKGKIMLATYSELGPEECTGLPVTQYSESNLMKLFAPELHMIRWQYYDHVTPAKNKQNYIYSCFSKPV
ncbi:MAG: class I SAM-dependent methyltransferase [Clostridia bacterium]|nr:class I SAM-dependent methyltransferase [Clostridia bacterium]